jgi:arylsulfatase A-like enzyme
MSHQTEARRVAWRGWSLASLRRPQWITVRWLKPSPTPRPLPTALSGYAVFAVVLLLPGALKAWKATHSADAHPSALDLLRVLSADVVLACVSLAFALGFARLARRWRRGAWVFFTATTLYLLILLELTALEHQAWVRSSSLLDWSIFWYSIEHYRELKPIVAAETTVFGVVLLAGSALLAFAPLLVDWFGARFLGKEALPRVRPALYALIAAMPFAWLASGSPSAPSLYPLTQSAAVGLVGGAFSAVRRPADGSKHFAPADVKRARERIERSLAAANFTQTSEPGHPKNVLLLVLESTRFDATSVYVPRLRNTPRLQKLAEHGAVVTHAYADMPHTSKALVSIICGYSPRFSVEVSEVEPGGLPRPCLPHILGHLGYRRGFFQAATGTYESRHQFATNAGFEDIFTRESYDETGFEQINYLAVEDKVMIDPIMRWVDAKPDKPFLLTILTCTTHHSYGLPSRYPLRQFPRQPAEMGGRMPRPWTEYNRYLNTVEYVDQFMGALVDGLEKRGKLDDTLIVVTGDHGQGFYEHGQKAHNTVIWDEGLHVPLVVSNPQIFPEPKTVEGVRRQVDIIPTILPAIGVSTPEKDFFEGRNLLTGEEHEHAYSSCWYNERCMAETTGSLRVIDNFDKQPMEVYDLSADPFERTNLLLTGTPEERKPWEEKAKAARERMRAHIAQVDDFYTRQTEGDHQDFLLTKEPEPTYEVHARIGDSLELLGYDTPSHEVVPDGFWDAIVYFKCLAPIQPGWRLFGVLETADGRQDQVDHHPANGRFYLHQCKPGSIVADHVRVWIPGDFPPGEVRYWWGAVLLKDLGHVTQDNKRLARADITPMQRGVLVQDRGLLLSKLQVKAQYRPDLAELLRTAISKTPPKIDHPLDVRFGDSLTLLDARVAPLEVRRQSSVTVTTVWRVDGKVTGPWQLMVHMDSRINGYWLRRTHTPVDGIHPIANWEPGTYVTDTYTMPIAAYMPAGEAKIWLGVRRPGQRMDVSNPGKAEIDENRRMYAGTIQIRP